MPWRQPPLAATQRHSLTSPAPGLPLQGEAAAIPCRTSGGRVTLTCPPSGGLAAPHPRIPGAPQHRRELPLLLMPAVETCTASAVQGEQVQSGICPRFTPARPLGAYVDDEQRRHQQAPRHWDARGPRCATLRRCPSRVAAAGRQGKRAKMACRAWWPA